MLDASPPLQSPLLVLLIAAAGCTADMNDMMDNMGGHGFDRGVQRPPDRGPLDAEPDMAPDADPHEGLPEPGPALTVHALALRGSFQSYHLLDPPVGPPTNFEHPDFPTQLGVQGVRGLHFNLGFNTSGVFEVFNHGLLDMQSRCLGSVNRCFEPIGAWSRANPRHAPIVIALDDPVTVDTGGFDGTLDLLQHDIAQNFDRRQIFTMDDLRAGHPGLTVREIVTRGLWPPLEEMRGRFIFMILEPMARQSLRDLAWGLDEEPEVFYWPFVDGTDDDELAADDAAIAVLPPLEDAAAVARAEQVIDRGYLTWTEAHSAVTYARAHAAGVHVIVSKFPDALFPAPGADDWPVGCNPRTAPADCRPRQIENRLVPE